MNKIPFYSLEPQHEKIGKEMLEVIRATAASNWFVLGARLDEFERAYATFSGCQFAAGVANGLDAIFLSLRALGIKPGDEVIVPANTYFATWLAVSMTGAKPLPVDADPITLNIDIAKLEGTVTPKTRAVIPVHLYGRACDMTSIMDIARRRGLFVVEDNAQGHGAMHSGRMTGTFGDVNATSFYPTKNLGALGDGGAVTTDNPDLNKAIRMLRNYGSSEKYIFQVPGINSRLDELHAAVLSIKLKHLHAWNKERVIVAEKYRELLAGVGDIVLPSAGKTGEHIYHLFVIRTDSRNGLADYLTSKGIGTLVHYPVPPHLQEVYRDLGYTKGAWPVAEDIARTCLSLPIWPGMKEETVGEVCEAIRDFF